MAFQEADGAFLWQMVHDKLASGEANDWPFQGGVLVAQRRRRPPVLREQPWGGSWRSTRTDSATARNDPPFTGEIRDGPADADVVWIYDMIAELDVFPHNMSSSAPRRRRRSGDRQHVEWSGRGRLRSLSPHAPRPDRPRRAHGSPRLARRSGRRVDPPRPVVVTGRGRDLGGPAGSSSSQGDGWVRGFDVYRWDDALGVTIPTPSRRSGRSRATT